MIPCPDCGQYKLDKHYTSLCHLIDGCKDRLITVFCECGYKGMFRIKPLNNKTNWEVLSGLIQDR